MTKIACARLSRRAFLGASVAGIGAALRPLGLGAETTGGEAAALAFDGAALIAARRGLFRSDDGAAWTALAAPGAEDLRSLATHPARPGLILAGRGGGGLALSADGGQTWTDRGQGLPALPVAALAVAATAPDTFLAAVTGDGLWQSADRGASWSFAMDRPWIAEAEREVLALASVDLASGMGGIWVYAGTPRGLIRVPDCFCRWQEVQPGDAMAALAAGTAPPPRNPLPVGAPVHALVSAPAAPDRLYAALASGVWASADAGVNWTRAADLEAAALAAHPADPDRLAALTADGASLSRDGGATWSAALALPPAS